MANEVPKKVAKFRDSFGHSLRSFLFLPLGFCVADLGRANLETIEIQRFVCWKSISPRPSPKKVSGESHFVGSREFQGNTLKESKSAHEMLQTAVMREQVGPNRVQASPHFRPNPVNLSRNPRTRVENVACLTWVQELHGWLAGRMSSRSKLTS
ncbi:hypothetical protein [Pacificoceanicola onchidii]|uniref:hypothetical protein n=1 Tax=Pacificoceanicola onchidii TaxID=2562685 RepID=UPI0010A2B5A8|nr:hypothetical protein [Pacificoceanicola onchidii]